MSTSSEPLTIEYIDNEINNIIRNYYRKTGNTNNANIKLQSDKLIKQNIITLLQSIENASEIQYMGQCNETYSSIPGKLLHITTRSNHIFKIVFHDKQGKQKIKLLKLILKSYDDSYYVCNLQYNSFIPHFYSYIQFNNSDSDDHAKKFLRFLYKNVSEEDCEHAINIISNSLVRDTTILNSDAIAKPNYRLVGTKIREYHLEFISMRFNKYPFDYNLIMLDKFTPILNDLNLKEFAKNIGNIMIHIIKSNFQKYNYDANDRKIRTRDDAQYSKSIYDSYGYNEEHDLYTKELNYFIANFHNISIKANILYYLNYSEKHYEKLNKTNILVILPNNNESILHNHTQFINMLENILRPSSIQQFTTKFANNTSSHPNYINNLVQIIKPYIYYTHAEPSTKYPLSYFYHGANRSETQTIIDVDLKAFLTIQNILEYEYINVLHQFQNILDHATNKPNNKYVLEPTYASGKRSENVTKKDIDDTFDKYYILYNTNCEYNTFCKTIQYT